MQSVEEAKAQELLRQLGEKISMLVIRAEDEEKARIEVEEENRKLMEEVKDWKQHYSIIHRAATRQADGGLKTKGR